MERKQPSEIWNIASKDAQKLASLMAIQLEEPMSREHIDAIASDPDPEVRFESEKALQELKGYGVLKEVTGDSAGTRYLLTEEFGQYVRRDQLKLKEKPKMFRYRHR